MNGLEAIELMKQGKMVIQDVYIYRFYGNEFQWITTTGLSNHAEWRKDGRFELNACDYEEYIEPKQLTGWHVKGKQRDFWMMHSGGDIEDEKYWHEDGYRDEDRFSTKEKAEEINFKQTLFRKLQRFSDENGGNEIDWNDASQSKFSISYSYVFDRPGVDYSFKKHDFGQVYFISEEVAEQAIELFYDELIKYFTHDWGGKNEASTIINSKER